MEQNRAIDLWDIDNKSNLTPQEKYDLAINLYNTNKLNSVLVNTEAFKQYLTINNPHKLGIIYTKQLTTDKNKDLRNEFYDYLDTLSNSDITTLLISLTSNQMKIIVKYLTDSYISGYKSLKDVEDIIIDGKDKLYSHFLSFFTTVIRTYRKKNIIPVMLTINRIEKVLDISFFIPFIIAKYLTYDEFKRCIYNGINLLDDGIMAEAFINSYKIDLEKVLSYYVRYGLTYQYVFNTIITVYSNLAYYGYYKKGRYIALYLLETRDVTTKNLYKRSDKIRLFLDEMILNQI